MAKKYDEVENRTATIQRKTKTLSFRPAVEEADLNHFMQFVKGKVSMNLYDFTAGKGDHAFNICYNFDLPDVEYLYEHAKISSLAVPYQATKFLGAYPEKEGPHKGMAKNTRITIKRDPYIVDKTSGEKKPAPNPWIINLEVGWAKPAKSESGMYFPAKGTYKKERAGYIALTDVEFLHCFSKTIRFIRKLEDMVAPELIQNGFQLLEKQQERGSYMEEEAENYDRYDDMEAEAEEYSVETHPLEIRFISIGKADNGEIQAAVDCKGKQYKIVIDSLSEDKRNAYQNKELITVSAYQKDGVLHCL